MFSPFFPPVESAESDLSFKMVGEWSFPQDIFIVWVDPDELGDPTKPQEKLVGKKLLGCPGKEVDGWMVRINGLFHLLINGGIPWGERPIY